MSYFQHAFNKVTTPAESLEALDGDKYNIHVLENNAKDPIYLALKKSIIGLAKQLSEAEDKYANSLPTDVAFLDDVAFDTKEMEGDYDSQIVRDGVIHIVVTNKTNSKALGMARCYRNADFAEVYLFINWLVVDKKLRGNGIGQELLSACEELAKQRNMAYLELSVLANNDVAQKTYNKAGFTDVFHTMVKSIK